MIHTWFALAALAVVGLVALFIVALAVSLLSGARRRREDR